jgi:hypothetical protein
MVPAGVETGPDAGGYYLRSKLSHDFWMDPEIYYSQMAIFQMCQQGNVVLCQPTFICGPLTNIGGGADGLYAAMWSNATWAGMPAGRGDGTGTSTAGCIGTTDGVNAAGTAITNKFYGALGTVEYTGQSQSLNNASPVMQAARDWMEAANTAPTTTGIGLLLESGASTFLEDSANVLILEQSSGAIATQNWDGVTAPALPSGWTYGSGLSTTSTFFASIVPTSSPNALVTGVGGALQFATYGTLDGAGGNVSVSANFNETTAANAARFGVFLRSNANPTVSTTSTFYSLEVQLTPGGNTLSLFKTVLGSYATIAGVNLTSWNVPGWYQLTLTASGTSLTGTVQRLLDGFYLNSSGLFTATVATAITATDTQISGTGYSGVFISNNGPPGNNIYTYTDDWVLAPAGGAVSSTLVTSVDTWAVLETGITIEKIGDIVSEVETAILVDFVGDMSVGRDTLAVSLTLWGLDFGPANEAALTLTTSGVAVITSSELGIGIERELVLSFGGDSALAVETSFQSALFLGGDFGHGAGEFARGYEQNLNRVYGTEADTEVERELTGITSTTISFADFSQEYDTYLVRILGAGDTINFAREAVFVIAVTTGVAGSLDYASAQEKHFLNAQLLAFDFAFDFATAYEASSVEIIVVGYYVYSNTGVGDAINYGSPIAELIGYEDTSWVSAALTHPGDWKFGVRAFNTYGIEQNVNCEVEIILDGAGNDITNLPAAPSGLSATALANSDIRVSWTELPSSVAKQPTGFHVYTDGGTGTVNYATPVATVLFSSGFLSTFQTVLTGLTSGTTYIIGVRAYNASAEEQNTNTVSCTASATGPGPVINLTGTVTSES